MRLARHTALRRGCAAPVNGAAERHDRQQCNLGRACPRGGVSLAG